MVVDDVQYEINWKRIKPLLSHVKWNYHKSKQGRKLYAFKQRLNDPNYNNARTELTPISLFFLFGRKDNPRDLAYHSYAIHYLREEASRLTSAQDLKRWVQKVDSFPPGTPLISGHNPLGILNTFIGIKCGINPLPPCFQK